MDPTLHIVKQIIDTPRNFDIIIPTTGRETLQKSIDSVLGQSYKFWTLYVIGDGHVPEVPKHEQIYVTSIKGPNNDYGTKARNFGIKIGFSEWITYLDDDDEWFPNHLETFNRRIQNFPDHNMLKTSGQGFKMGFRHPRSGQKVEKSAGINTTDIMTVGMCHSRKLFEKTKGWQPGDGHDRKLWQDMIDAGGTPYYDQTITFKYHV